LYFTITVIQPVTVNQSVSICDGDAFTVGNNAYTSSGTYADTLTSSFGCDSTVNTVLTVQPVIDTNVVYASGVLTSPENGAAYQWINCSNEQTIGGATSQSFTPLQNGDYAVIVTNGPCTDTSMCYTVNDVGISDHAEATFTAVITTAPNAIHVHTIGAQNEVRYQLYDAAGRMISDRTGNAGQPVTFMVESTGVYLLVLTNDGRQFLQRVIVTEQ
jgi:hypothetical protein